MEIVEQVSTYDINKFILDILLSSKKGAETNSFVICQMANKKFDLRGVRLLSPPKIRKIINQFRRDEVPVIGNSKGYYISYDAETIQGAIISLNGRIEGINLAINGLRACLINVINNIGYDE